MIYLDTSALLKLYIHESGSCEVQKVRSSQSDPLPLWEIQVDLFVSYDVRQVQLAKQAGLRVFGGLVDPS